MISEEQRERFRWIRKNPRQWFRGEGIPEENLTPWELLLYVCHNALKGMFDGFAGKQDFLYKEYYRIPPNKITIAGIVSSIWDAINDPILGAWMDRKRFGPQQLKTIMRLSAITGSILAVVKLFDGGMSIWQHLVVLMFCNMSSDILGTMNGIADQKWRSGTSPSSQQRSRINVWSDIGSSITWAIGNLPVWLMSFRDVLGWTDYQIIFTGACIFLPFGIVAWILPTFVRQRVDYSYIYNAPTEADSGDPPPKRTLMETFALVKHNRYFLANVTASFITVFSPDMGDELMIYRYLMPKMKLFGIEMGGEALLPIKQLISGTLSNIMQPFQRQIINFLGGPLRTQQLKCLVNMVCKLSMFFVGYKSIWRFAGLVFIETIVNATGGIDRVSGGMLDYQWYDYVELQTGERTEGVTSAVNNLFSKIVTNNIGQATGNWFLQWTGYQGGYTIDGTRPPERYLKFMWPMYTLIPVLDHGIWMIARSFVKWKPEDSERTELALAERRAAREQILEESNAT